MSQQSKPSSLMMLMCWVNLTFSSYLSPTPTSDDWWMPRIGMLHYYFPTQQTKQLYFHCTRMQSIHPIPKTISRVIYSNCFSWLLAPILVSFISRPEYRKSLAKRETCTWNGIRGGLNIVCNQTGRTHVT
jgi:hypothetical protein